MPYLCRCSASSSTPVGASSVLGHLGGTGPLFEVWTCWLPGHRQLWESCCPMAPRSARPGSWAGPSRASREGGGPRSRHPPHPSGPCDAFALLVLNDHSETWFTMSSCSPHCWLCSRSGRRAMAPSAACPALGSRRGRAGARTPPPRSCCASLPCLPAADRPRAHLDVDAIGALASRRSGRACVRRHRDRRLCPVEGFDGTTGTWSWCFNTNTTLDAAAGTIKGNFELWWQLIMTLANGEFFGLRIRFTSNAPVRVRTAGDRGCGPRRAPRLKHWSSTSVATMRKEPRTSPRRFYLAWDVVLLYLTGGAVVCVHRQRHALRASLRSLPRRHPARGGRSVAAGGAG